MAGLLAIAPIGGGKVRGSERSLEVHLDHRVPFFFAHVGHHPVAQDTRVVDDAVQVAEGVDGCLDQAFGSRPCGDVVAIGDRLAAHRLDFVDHLLRRRDVATGAVDTRAEVVHDDVRAVAGKAQGMLTADSATRSGDNNDTTLT